MWLRFRQRRASVEIIQDHERQRSVGRSGPNNFNICVVAPRRLRLSVVNTKEAIIVHMVRVYDKATCHKTTASSLLYKEMLIHFLKAPESDKQTVSICCAILALGLNRINRRGCGSLIFHSVTLPLSNYATPCHAANWTPNPGNIPMKSVLRILWPSNYRKHSV